MRRSYRIRGRVARVHRKRKAIKSDFSQKKEAVKFESGMPPKNRIAVKNLRNRILIYSAIKIKANVVALYSTLNPDTSSDSPSAKSKGDRLVSARVVINQTEANGMEINRKGT